MSPQDVLTIDPVAMNVVNRIAKGSSLDGEYFFEGGLLLQGRLSGRLEIRGPLIIWTGAVATGRIKIHGDFYLFGQLGASGEPENASSVECLGTVYIANTGVSSGTLFAHRIRMYDGAQLQGPFKTLKPHASLPELHDVAQNEPHADADADTAPHR